MTRILKALSLASIAASMLLASNAYSEGTTETPDVGESPDWIIAIHGGAGGTQRDSMSKEQEQQVRDALTAALVAGAKLLESGAPGTQAVEAAIQVLENSPLFNAGRGAALNEYGAARHDASIMRGEDLAAGAIAGSSRIKNPISAARAVMEKSNNVLLHGDGADWFAVNNGVEMTDPHYFVTEKRRELLRNARAADPDEMVSLANTDAAFGTVGAVVIDRHGNLAAGTSTGGRTNKRYGRVGDTPIIGAATYASNTSCAVSATGHGEYFMRWTVARDICARVEFADESLERAAQALLIDALLDVDGRGGIVSLDPEGNVVFVMTTANMKRGVMSSATPAKVAVYSDESVSVK